MMSAFLGFLFITLTGTLLHFVYEWSGQNKLVALIGAVNESTWEHMKIAAIPAFVWSIVEIPFLGDQPNFVVAKLVAIITMLLSIPLIFYGYQLIIHKSILAIDIGLFVVSIGLGQWLSTLVLNINPVPVIFTYISFIVLVVLFLACLLLTLMPIRIFLFRDPINGKYGVKAYESH